MMRLLCSFVLFLAPAAAQDARLVPPNVVLVIADDLGMQLGCYGDAKARTPHIDALAAVGVRFEAAYATVASCSSSRSSILTGRFSHATAQYGLQHAQHNFEGHAREIGLSLLLQGAGYRSLRVGKLHVGPDSSFPFDEVLKASSRNPVQMADAVDAALKAESGQPFFLLFCPSDPHRGGGSAKELRQRPDRFGNPAPGQTRDGVQQQVFDPARLSVPPWLPDTPACRAEWAQYYQSVARVDQGIGRLREVLQTRGVLDNTVFVFTSDHGPAFPGAKTTVYQPGLQVPLILAGAGVAATGESRAQWASLVDLLPTLLDLCGLPTADGPPLHGRTLVPLLSDPPPQWQRDLFASHTLHEVTMYYPMRSIRRGRYKLIVNFAAPLAFPFASDLYRSATWQEVLKSGRTQYGIRTVARLLQRPRLELYDLQIDPWESRNLAQDASHQQIRIELSGALKAWQEGTHDPWRLKWDRE